MDLNKVCEMAVEFVKSAGDSALVNWNNISIEKHIDGVDVTTSTDKKIEKDFFEFVQKNFPETGFKGEEFQELNKEGEYYWMIDPIDGTKFYAAEIPFWTVTVALVYKDEPVVGIIYNPVSNQLYSAIKGKGAYLNGKQIHVTSESNISKVQVSLDMAINSEQFIERSEKITQMLDRLYASVYRVRSLGAGAISLSWLAQGFFGAFVDPYRKSSKFVDVYGGLLIAQEAGAVVYKHKLEGEEDLYSSIVGNKEIVEQLIPIIETLGGQK
jgi:myo-inositol-1(or 4)-monophosphatase